MGNGRLIYEAKLTAREWLVLMTSKIMFSKITMSVKVVPTRQENLYKPNLFCIQGFEVLQLFANGSYDRTDFTYLL